MKYLIRRYFNGEDYKQTNELFISNAPLSVIKEKTKLNGAYEAEVYKLVAEIK